MSKENFQVENYEENASTHREKPWRKVFSRLLIALGILIFLGLVVLAIFYLTQNPTVTTNVRDIFIILLAFESFVIGLALIILVIQIAALINFIQNEIRPIIMDTQETINHLKGTTEFISKRFTRPIIKLNSYFAGFKKILDLIRPKRR
jgi:flagellar biogenesis protein FliO